MTKKILLLVLLAGFAVIATDALSQTPGSGGAPAAASPPATSSPATPAPSSPALFPPATDKAASPSTTNTTPGKSDVAAPAAKDSVPKADAAKEIGSKDTTSGKNSPTAKDSSKETSSKETPPGKSAPPAKDASKDASSSKTIPTSTVVPGSIPARGTLVVERALVTLIDDNKVPATEPGMLMKVAVKEGDFVQKDDQVAEIDTRSTVAKMRIAESEHLAARAQSENDAEVEVAEAAIKVALAELEQDKEIRKSTPQAVSMSQVRKDEFNYEKSLAQKKQAINEKKIAGLTANAKHAQFEAASIELDLRQIRAPFNGVVVLISKNPGDWVTAGEPIMHIVGLDKVRVKGFVLASGSEGISAAEVYGKDVKITVDTAGGKKHTVNGKIGFASPVIEGVGTSRQFRIWAEVDNDKTIDPVTKQVAWKLQPGSVATMTIDLTPPKPSAPGRADATKGDGKTQTFKPVTGEEKAGSKKSKTREF